MNVHSSAGDKKGVAKLSATLTEDATALGVKKQKVSNGIESIEILAPDDFHHHLRDGDVLSHVLPHVVKQFTRVVIMPNLVPPIKNHRDAVAYHDRLMYYTPCEYAVKFQPLMTMYLTDSTSPATISEAFSSGLIKAAKLYPAGATTNSHHGVTSIEIIAPALKKMEKLGMPLLVHGEVTDPTVDIFDREREFINRVLKPLLIAHPKLRVVMEHITTSEAVEFVRQAPTNVAATITAHHLLYNRSDLFKGGICPHMYCLPILKREAHRVALLEAATSGTPKFFIGTDSAPHAVERKESACGCAGIYTAHAAIELYAEAFDSIGALDKLEGFTSIFGQQFYGIGLNTRKIRLIKESWTVPETYAFGKSTVRPLRAGEEIKWKLVSK